MMTRLRKERPDLYHRLTLFLVHSALALPFVGVGLFLYWSYAPIEPPITFISVNAEREVLRPGQPLVVVRSFTVAEATEFSVHGQIHNLDTNEVWLRPTSPLKFDQGTYTHKFIINLPELPDGRYVWKAWGTTRVNPLRTVQIDSPLVYFEVRR